MKTKALKKNWILRSVGIVLMFTLISTCLLSSTLAKYITSASGTDTARVAKFGVTVASNPGLFKTTYEKVAGESYVGMNTVISSDKVVAPGTSGSAAGFSLSGTPEVAVRVKVNIDSAASIYGQGWVDEDGAKYDPIKWTLKKDGTAVSGVNQVSFDTLTTALDNISADYAPGNLATAAINDTYTIEWEWPFNVNAANDTKDTFLGDKAAAGASDLTIALKFNVTVTQID